MNSIAAGHDVLSTSRHEGLRPRRPRTVPRAHPWPWSARGSLGLYAAYLLPAPTTVTLFEAEGPTRPDTRTPTTSADSDGRRTPSIGGFIVHNER